MLGKLIAQIRVSTFPKRVYGSLQPRQAKLWVGCALVTGLFLVGALCLLLRKIMPPIGAIQQVASSVDNGLGLSAETTLSPPSSEASVGSTIAPLWPQLANKEALRQYLVAHAIGGGDATSAIEALERVRFFQNTAKKVLSFFISTRPLTLRFEVRSSTPIHKRCGSCERYVFSLTQVGRGNEASAWVPQITYAENESMSYVYTLLPASLVQRRVTESIWPSFVDAKVKDVLLDARRLFQLQAGHTVAVLLKRVKGTTTRLSVAYIGYRTKADTAFALWRLRAGRFDDFVTQSGIRLQPFSLQKPLNQIRISSPFGLRLHPILNVRLQHNGVDLSAPMGTPVTAGADGFVTTLSSWGGYGKHIVLKHTPKYETLYGHMNAFAKNIQVGSFVFQGQVIGYVGSTGISTGPHLHYEVRYSGKAIEPLKVQVKERDQMLFDPLLRALFDQERAATRAVLIKTKRMMGV